MSTLVTETERDVGCRMTVGVGIPGAISPATALVKNANSVWLNGRRLSEDLERALERPVRIANDANCFALSEAADGAAAGASPVFGVIIGTGTGGGVVVSASRSSAQMRSAASGDTTRCLGHATMSAPGRPATAAAQDASRRSCRVRVSDATVRFPVRRRSTPGRSPSARPTATRAPRPPSAATRTGSRDRLPTSSTSSTLRSSYSGGGGGSRTSTGCTTPCLASGHRSSSLTASTPGWCAPRTAIRAVFVVPPGSGAWMRLAP